MRCEHPFPHGAIWTAALFLWLHAAADAQEWRPGRLIGPEKVPSFDYDEPSIAVGSSQIAVTSAAYQPAGQSPPPPSYYGGTAGATLGRPVLNALPVQLPCSGPGCGQPPVIAPPPPQYAPPPPQYAPAPVVAPAPMYLAPAITPPLYRRFGGDVFFGASAWKNQADDDDNNNFGLLTSGNAAYALNESFGVQAGASYGGYDLHGREDVTPSKIEQQIFATVGAYRRSNVLMGDRISGGVVFDYMHDNAFGEDGDDSLDLQQFRGAVGIALTNSDEIGFSGNWGIRDDFIMEAGNQVRINVIDQYNLYWKRGWQFGGDTNFYVGIPDGEPGEVSVGFYGMVPLAEYFGVTGGWHYIIPSARGGNASDEYEQETWSLFFGIVFYPGGGYAANSVSGNVWQPLLPVANNGVMPSTPPTPSNF